MQAEIQTKVKISVAEIKKILAEKFCLYHDFEVEIIADSVVESETVKQDNEGWIDVPLNWEHFQCPTNICTGTMLEIIQRNGIKRYVKNGREVASLWSQDNYYEDIVKYRVVQ